MLHILIVYTSLLLFLIRKSLLFLCPQLVVKTKYIDTLIKLLLYLLTYIITLLRSSSDKWRLVIKPYNLITCIKTYGLRAFSVIARILWKDLPIDIRSTDDVNKSKSKLKTFLFKRVYELS